MANMLIDLLRQLTPTGQSGFEGLIANLLQALTGRQFYLARSGSQAGLDMRSDHHSGSVIAVECKRYGQNNELDQRMLLGELSQAARDIPDLDVWLLVASRKVSSQLYTALSADAHQRGIEFRSLSTDDGSPCSLEALCALSPEMVMTHIETTASEEERQEVKSLLDEIRAYSGFKQAVERMKKDFSSEFVGYGNWCREQNDWLIGRFRSEIASRAVFRQLLNVEEEGIGLVERQTAWNELDDWLNKWGETRRPFVLLGEEGDGKTWAVAAWLARKIRTEEDFPPVVFLPSTDVSSDAPEFLLPAAISRRLHNQGDESFWQKRLNGWMQRPPSAQPVLLLVLDGINERREPSWWRGLLERFATEPWRDHVAVLMTCRVTYWHSYFSKLRYLSQLVCASTLPPYDDGELQDALKQFNLHRSDIPDSLLPLITKPRYFDLMVKHRARMAESGDITVARLIYEDWRDRFERKSQTGLDDETFRNIIRDLAINKLRGVEYLTERDVNTLLPPYSDKEVILRELSTGGILQGRGNRYQVDERLLILGFGLLLADQVEKNATSGDRVPDQTIAEWLEPYSEMDIKARICEEAVLHALSTPEFPEDGRVSLLRAWTSSRNPGQEIEKSFIAYLPQNPESYIKLAESVWSYVHENPWAQELIVQALVRWGRILPSIRESLRDTFERWLGFVHPSGFPTLRGGNGKKADEIRQEIVARMGCDLEPGRFTFAGRTLTIIEDDGLLRLGRAALAIISHLPRGPFIHAIATGCVAEAIMGHPDKYSLFAWVVASAPDLVWDEIDREVKELLTVNHIVTKQAAHRLLSFEGSPEARRFQRTLPQDIFPPNPLRDWYERDHCTSGFVWNKEDCKNCLQREDLKPYWIAKQIKPFCVDPDLAVPKDLGVRLSAVVEEIDAKAVLSNDWTTSEDILLEEIEPALYAYAPNALADLIRHIACQVDSREDIGLRQLTLKLDEHYLIFGEEERAKIHRAWISLHAKGDGLSDTEQFAEQFLFALVLKDLELAEQLHYLLDRSDDRNLLAYERSFKPSKDWDVIRDELAKATDAKKVRRILWVISAHPENIPSEICSDFLPLIMHDDTRVRGLAFHIFYATGFGPAIETVIKNSWAWDRENCIDENHWGSLLLCKYANALPYPELRQRIHPSYLGYAVERRGMQENEVRQYAEDLHRNWQLLASEVPDLPEDFPSAEVGCDTTENIEVFERVGLSHGVFSKSITFVNRDAFWGGVSAFKQNDLQRLLMLQDNEKFDEHHKSLFKILRETVEEQTRAGNPWFARRFSIRALDQVVRQDPDLVNLWLESVLTDHPQAVRHLSLGQSFYEALCKTLLNYTPEKGVALYFRLQEVTDLVRFQVRGTGIRLLDYDLFDAPLCEQVMSAWHRRLMQCRTDRELLEIAIVAQAGNGQDWLWSLIEEGLESPILLDQARSLTLLGFIGTEPARKLLNQHRVNQPETWLEHLVETSMKRWQTNEWAKHWFHGFLSADDDINAWRSFGLFLQCVDSRFWHWRQLIEDGMPSHSGIKKRQEFFEDNEDTVKKAVKRNEKSLSDNFLGHKVLKDQVWPWMQVD